MSPTPIFEHEVDFQANRASEILLTIPAAQGVVCLFGAKATDRPYMLKGANLRRRLQRLLEPAEGQTKRLNLRERIARIAWRETTSELESLLLLYRAASVLFGVEEARRKLRLSPPYTVRYAAENRFPRIYVTNHLRRRSLETTFGPFASRFAAERYREAVEELFLIRRCYLDLHPSPEDPGCIYGEMRKCLAPCQQRCSGEEYAHESQATLAFLQTRGRSVMTEIEQERDRASGEMRFEDAAAARARAAKVKSAAALADDLVQPLAELQVLLAVPLPPGPEPQVNLFLFTAGRLRGPETLPLTGVRLAREQSEVGSSLFAQPMLLAPIPEDGGTLSESSAETPEERLAAAIARLVDGTGAEDTAALGDHLALLRRWYYRPEKQRAGVAFFQERGSWPLRKILRAAAKLHEPPKEAAIAAS